ncbi:hypothetical protein WS68_13680 [Burkholderia sp. TSV86]|nr:hypothetical protein WS68_13680 [Burkholderia sp. TSV86]
MEISMSIGALQNDKVRNGRVIANLTCEMLGLRGDWLRSSALRWDRIQAIGENAVTESDKLIASAFREGFVRVSQFLCGLEVLALELQELGVVSEEAVLRFEELLVHLGDDRR